MSNRTQNSPWFRFDKAINDRKKAGDAECDALTKGSISNGGDSDGQGAAVSWAKRVLVMQGMSFWDSGVNRMTEPTRKALVLLKESSKNKPIFNLAMTIYDLLEMRSDNPNPQRPEDAYALGSLLNPVGGLVMQVKRVGMPDIIRTAQSTVNGRITANQVLGDGWDVSFLPDPHPTYDYTQDWRTNHIPWNTAFRYLSHAEVVEQLSEAFQPHISMYAFQGHSKFEEMVPVAVRNLWGATRGRVPVTGAFGGGAQAPAANGNVSAPPPQNPPAAFGQQQPAAFGQPPAGGFSQGTIPARPNIPSGPATSPVFGSVKQTGFGGSPTPTAPAPVMSPPAAAPATQFAGNTTFPDVSSPSTNLGNLRAAAARLHPPQGNTQG